MLIYRIILVIIGALICYVMSRLLLMLLKNLSLRSKTDDAMLRWSSAPKPPTGGILFFIAVLFAWICYDLPFFTYTAFQWLWLAGAVVGFAVGLIDDLKRLSPRIKFIGQILAALFLVLSGHVFVVFEMPFIDIGLTIFLVVASMNAINMLDNMDGVAGSVVFAICFYSLLIENDVMMTMAMCSALIAFLISNWRPSTIYMGDSGSLLLGYVVASLFCLQEPSVGEIQTIHLESMIHLIAILIVPIVDSMTVSIQRLRHGISPFHGGRDHTTHQLVYAGLKESWVPIVMVVITIISSGTFYLTHSNAIGWSINVFIFLTFLSSMLWLSSRNLRRGKFEYRRT